RRSLPGAPWRLRSSSPSDATSSIRLLFVGKERRGGRRLLLAEEWRVFAHPAAFAHDRSELTFGEAHPDPLPCLHIGGGAERMPGSRLVGDRVSARENRERREGVELRRRRREALALSFDDPLDARLEPVRGVGQTRAALPQARRAGEALERAAGAGQARP